VQSALLEVMQEKQVTIGGETFRAPTPFLVIATQNPVEQEGTYPLSEAQTDRFMMKVLLTYPSRDEEQIILNRINTSHPLPEISPMLNADDILYFRKLVNEVYIDEKILSYILDIIQTTRQPENYQLIQIKDLLDYGASPRATLALKQAAKAHALLKGRYFVNPQDVKEVCFPILRHRLRLSYEAEAEKISPDNIIHHILDSLPAP
jgi:MoxR-like ATPase